jgi:hypothetical protein
MNDRDEHLSKAIDALTELHELLVGMAPIHQSSRIVRLAHEAIEHVEDASSMPKPSKLRSIVNRLRDAA